MVWNLEEEIVTTILLLRISYLPKIQEQGVWLLKIHKSSTDKTDTQYNAFTCLLMPPVLKAIRNSTKKIYKKLIQNTI